MATFASNPPALIPLQKPQQSAAAARGLQHQHQHQQLLQQLQHQAGDQLGAVLVAEADAQTYPVDGFFAPGHFNFSHDPDADLNNALDYLGVLPSSGPQEQVLRRPPEPSSSSPVSQQPVRQTSPVCIALPRSRCWPFDCLFSPLITRRRLFFFSRSPTRVLSRSCCASICHSINQRRITHARVYTWLTVCATRNDKFRRCSSGRSAPCRATTPRRTNSPTPPTTQMVSSE